MTLETIRNIREYDFLEARVRGALRFRKLKHPVESPMVLNLEGAAVIIDELLFCKQPAKDGDLRGKGNLCGAQQIC